MKYRFKPTQRFWESFYALSPSQKDSTRHAWKIFKENPFDPRLRSHKIHKLSARYGRTIYAAEIGGRQSGNEEQGAGSKERRTEDGSQRTEVGG